MASFGLRDPPNGLLSKIQAILVDFFWGTFIGYLRVYFFYPERKEDKDLFTFQAGGQLFDLFSFKGTSQDLRIWSGERWRTLSLIIAGRLGLNSALFLMDSSKLQCSGLTTFYKGLSKFGTYLKNGGWR